MTKWEYEIIDCEGLHFDKLGQAEWELVSVDDGIAYFIRPIVEDIETNAPWGETIGEQQEIILDKLKGVSDRLKFTEGHFGDWQQWKQKIEEALGTIND